MEKSTVVQWKIIGCQWNIGTTRAWECDKETMGREVADTMEYIKASQVM